MPDQYTPTTEEIKELKRALYDARKLIDALRDQIQDLQSDLCLCQPRFERLLDGPAPMTAVARVASSSKATSYAGIEYPSMQAAANAHGISRQAMSKRLRRNQEGN